MNPRLLKAFELSVQSKLPKNVYLSWNADPDALLGASTCSLIAKTIDTDKLILKMKFTEPNPQEPFDKDVEAFIQMLNAILKHK